MRHAFLYIMPWLLALLPGPGQADLGNPGIERDIPKPHPEQVVMTPYPHLLNLEKEPLGPPYRYQPHQFTALVVMENGAPGGWIYIYPRKCLHHT
jgi:hypothetical protein